MPNTEREEQRKQTINKITADGDPLSDATFKRSLEVMNSVIEDLIGSINKSSKSSNSLSWVIAISTTVLAIIGIIDLYLRFFYIGAKIH